MAVHLGRKALAKSNTFTSATATILIGGMGGPSGKSSLPMRIGSRAFGAFTSVIGNGGRSFCLTRSLAGSGSQGRGRFGGQVGLVRGKLTGIS